ncbi:GTP-binding protein [Mesorhizobium sp. M2A.F.Ca.ET.042.01.1.1]|nr:GTP-binding protein [Mesorhizobium sp. M2A.F.Ca.ET.042.01.1.1]
MRGAGGRTQARLPVTLVTGFLGSGKTTMINAALKAPELHNTVVVVNEFGEVSLDHSLVANSSDAVVVLENGCLCCTVRGDLVSTLNELYQARMAGRMPPFDNVVIETSGLAEPGPVVQAFLSEPTLDGLYRVASIVTLVDAVNWAETRQNHDEAVRQVALADQIRITKLDLAGPGIKEQLPSVLARLNPAAKIGQMTWETADIAALLTTKGFDAADPGADPRPWLSLSRYQATEAAHVSQDDCGHDHDHDDDHAHHHLAAKDIQSFVLLRDEPISRAELQFLLDGISQNLGPSLLRVKGLVNVAEEPGRPAVIQGAQHLLHTMTWLDKWPDKDERTRVVFITQGIPHDSLREVIELLDRLSARTFKARDKARAMRQSPGRQ